MMTLMSAHTISTCQAQKSTILYHPGLSGRPLNPALWLTTCQSRIEAAIKLNGKPDHSSSCWHLMAGV
jgi:hypothetical protein